MQRQRHRQQLLGTVLLLASLSAACVAQDVGTPQPVAIATTADAADPAASAAAEVAEAEVLDWNTLVTPQTLPRLPVQPHAADVQPGAVMAYVALGDSLTAGMQSAGLTAPEQYSAFPAVVARLTDIPFGIPATQLGCPVPMGGGLAEASCRRVLPGVRGSNFAVPGARAEDLYTKRGADSDDDLTRRLYGLILGPQLTQVEAALKSNPDYLTLWIGSNDALTAVTEGDPGRVTSPEEFERHYREILSRLKPAGARTLLLTVPDVTQVPLMTPGPVLFGQGVAEANCQGSESRLPLTAFLLGRKLDCDAPYALTPAEAQTIQQTVEAYNASIYRLAAEFGHDVLAVQPLMDSLEMHHAEDESSRTPFGRDMSADGVHLSSEGQRKLGYAVVNHVHRFWKVDLPAAAQAELAAAGLV
ncbi:SGNH/GDSL hydrolase family protein [Deinococcus radiophilus]|nr:SGNH/GDSL hydrolase family protein [Deinococcus radiophilus]UFA51553.1 SGNH/GDSL hydrolase family protein [Deinococcus radiophilus]